VSRFGKLGKHGNKAGGPASVIDSVRLRTASDLPKVLTPLELERKAAAQGKPGYVSYADFIADCRQHLDDPVGAGTGLSSHFTVDEDPRMVRSSGCNDSVW
jgi:hypothetical protein